MSRMRPKVEYHVYKENKGMEDRALVGVYRYEHEALEKRRKILEETPYVSRLLVDVDIVKFETTL